MITDLTDRFVIRDLTDMDSGVEMVVRQMRLALP